MAFEPDLLFSSKVEAASRKAGLSARVIGDYDSLVRELELVAPRVLVLNLDALEGKLATLVAASKSGPEIVGYYSHVNEPVADEAKRAGVRIVLSRAVFLNRLGNILEEARSR